MAEREWDQHCQRADWTGSVTAAERIIVALDLSEDKAREAAYTLRGVARWLKVGMTLYYSAGPEIVQSFRELGYRVFVDLKLHDIPHQVRGAASAITRAGADMFTVHGAGGLDMMKAAVAGAEQTIQEQGSKDQRPTILAITVLTSMDSESLTQVGTARPLEDQVAALAMLAQLAGLDGVVASPLEAQALRGTLGSQAAIVAPGVRPLGTSSDDQSRIATPAQALANGASHLVIGRPITGSTDPLAAFEAIVSEIEESCNDR